MSKLTAFLHPATATVTKEIVVSDRFKDEKGNAVPFVIKSLTQAENEALRKASMKTKKVNGQWVEQLDNSEYTNRLIVGATVEPDFRDADLCEAYGTKDPVQVPSLMLLMGEYLTLSRAIMEASGFGTDAGVNPDEDAKN